jgi:hypothetical protein
MDSTPKSWSITRSPKLKKRAALQEIEAEKSEGAHRQHARAERLPHVVV